MNRETLGLLLGMIGVIVFGATLPAMRIAVAAFEPAMITVGRASLAGALAAVTLLALRRPLPARADWPRLAIGSVMLAGGFPLFSSMALTTAEASHGGVMLALLPLGTAAAAVLLAGERPSGRFWLYAAAGSTLVLGFALLRSHGMPTSADGLFLLAGASAALGYAASGDLARRIPGWEVICWQLVLALPVMLTLTMALLPGLRDGVTVAAVPPAAWVSFAYVSLFSMYLGFFAWNAGLAMGGVARVGQTQLLQVFVTLGLSALLLGERVDAIDLGFAAAVVAAVAAGRRTKVSRPSA